jgi:hypothetical protein
VYNYYVFKVSEEDARMLEGNLNIEIPKEILQGEKDKGLKQSDVRVQMLTTLHPRECFLRLSANGQLLPCVKARTLDITVAPQLDKDVKLKEYDKAQDMPAKFKEDAQQQLASLDQPGQVSAPQIPSTPSLPTAAHSNQPQQMAPGQREYINLQDILAGQSSSKENQRKSK